MSASTSPAVAFMIARYADALRALGKGLIPSESDIGPAMEAIRVELDRNRATITELTRERDDAREHLAHSKGCQETLQVRSDDQRIALREVWDGIDGGFLVRDPELTSDTTWCEFIGRVRLAAMRGDA